MYTDLPYTQDSLKETAERYMSSFADQAAPIYAAVVKMHPPPQAQVSTEDLLCNIGFSLAYGGRMLLSKTKLKLKKGQVYGLCGKNGAGKSTLMRAISRGKVDGFPDLRCVYVEHGSVDNDEDDKDKADGPAEEELHDKRHAENEKLKCAVLDYLLRDSRVVDRIKESLAAAGSEKENMANQQISKDAIQERVRSTLLSLGFPETRLEQHVDTLSGGWKMKLELCRAILMEAELVLLDEPTNHLDVQNVQWLINYIHTQTGRHVADGAEHHNPMTAMIVSHDTAFLDHVCTWIVNYENKKLVYYPGNLSKYVRLFFFIGESVVNKVANLVKMQRLRWH
jgi:elongation factor 3